MHAGTECDQEAGRASAVGSQRPGELGILQSAGRWTGRPDHQGKVMLFEVFAVGHERRRKGDGCNVMILNCGNLTFLEVIIF